MDATLAARHDTLHHISVPDQGSTGRTAIVIDSQELTAKLWRANTRARKAGLTNQQRAVLDELGV